jgi:hypothetical protein
LQVIFVGVGGAWWTHPLGEKFGQLGMLPLLLKLESVQFVILIIGIQWAFFFPICWLLCFIDDWQVLKF